MNGPRSALPLDAMYLRGVIAGDAQLVEDAKAFAAIMAGRAACPDCGHEGPHEDNGASLSSGDFSLSCSGCGLSFQPLDEDGRLVRR